MMSFNSNLSYHKNTVSKVFELSYKKVRPQSSCVGDSNLSLSHEEGRMDQTLSCSLVSHIVFLQDKTIF